QPAKLAGATRSPFVAKLNAAGSAMPYATYLGGSANDLGNAIAVDAGGNAYVAGTALSADFPTQSPLLAIRQGPRDAFVAKPNPTGSALVYSTYLGGSGIETGTGIALDSTGQAFVVGWSYSDDFPITPGAFQNQKAVYGPEVSNAFIAKINAAGSGLVYASY